MTDDDEWALLDHHGFGTIPNFNGTLLLMESRQILDLSRINSTKGMAIRGELERHIGLEPGTLLHRPFPPPDSYEKLIDICNDEYEVVRNELVERGERAARWTLEYILESDRVIVPNREDFIELIKSWRVDPCAKAK